MATLITSNTFGRTLTVINRGSQALGVAGRTVAGNGSRDISFAKVLGNTTYMSQLNALAAAQRISLQLDGAALSADDAVSMDAPELLSVRLTRDVFTDVAAADPNAFKTALVAPAVGTTYAGSGDLDGVLGIHAQYPPRNVTITGTTGGGEALEAKVAVVTGICHDGVVRSENVSLTILGATDTVTDEGALAFTKLISVYFPADASGSPGDYEIGFGDVIGLTRTLSAGMLTKLFADNVEEAAAATVLSGSSLPHGTFTPTTAPDGSVDFVVCYVTAG